MSAPADRAVEIDVTHMAMLSDPGTVPMERTEVVCDLDPGYVRAHLAGAEDLKRTVRR